MFSRSFNSRSEHRASKARKPSKKSFGPFAKQQLLEQLGKEDVSMKGSHHNTGATSASSSAIITLIVGREQRLFAAHEDVLSRLPYFQQALKMQFLDGGARRLALVDEEPEAFSCILEYLYKGDYYPRLLQEKRRSAWYLEDSEADRHSPKLDGRRAVSSPAMYHSRVGDYILRDTVVYCAAQKYGGLEELKRLALRKQGLQVGVEVSCILRSARYAYDHTPEDDSRLRAHYLALIIRSRKTFKRSGTMQHEMEIGGRMFFDLFVAMCNHMDDLMDSVPSHGTPKTI